MIPGNFLRDNSFMTPVCDHIVGEKDWGYDGGQLIRKSENKGFKTLSKDDGDVVFDYCPMCGEKLHE